MGLSYYFSLFYYTAILIFHYIVYALQVGMSSRCEQDFRLAPLGKGYYIGSGGMLSFPAAVWLTFLNVLVDHFGYWNFLIAVAPAHEVLGTLMVFIFSLDIMRYLNEIYFDMRHIKGSDSNVKRYSMLPYLAKTHIKVHEEAVRWGLYPNPADWEIDPYDVEFACNWRFQGGDRQIVPINIYQRKQ